MILRRAIWSFVAFAGIGAAAFLAANALDYYRFNSAVRRIEGFSEDQFRALGNAAANVVAHEKTEKTAGFEALRPLRASLYPGSSEFLLYELKPTEPRFEDDNIYLYARISTSRDNQQILYFTNSEGKQRTKVVWNRNPEFMRQHAPSDRLITITQWSSGGRSWIVLKDRILVVDETGTVGSEPTIAGSIPLAPSALLRVQRAIDGLPTGMRGKDYRADGVTDGTRLEIHFTTDGESGREDITVSNTWVEDLRPLLTAISELSPKDCAITFIEHMTAVEHLHEYPCTVRTLAERDRLMWGKPNTPWWCVWRQWLQ